MHDLTAAEMYDSLNGYDELAVKKSFGTAPLALAQADSIEFARALVFVAERRNGASDSDAKSRALNLTNGELTKYFREEDGSDPLGEELKSFA